MAIRKEKILLYLKLNPKEIVNVPSIARDVSAIGHSGTEDFELTVESKQDFDTAKEFLEMAYYNVAGDKFGRLDD